MFQLGSIVLRNPNFGDSEKVNTNATHRASRGGHFTHAPGLFTCKVMTYEFEVVPCDATTPYTQIADVKAAILAMRGTVAAVTWTPAVGEPVVGNYLIVSETVEFINTANSTLFSIDLQEILGS